ncbi:unnamed protein product [Amoebophrya sp. A25]|nr:unnamed protein product [Amoebophrya sp. A25]|eukprot:GSA25T00017980001.1
MKPVQRKKLKDPHHQLKKGKGHQSQEVEDQLQHGEREHEQINKVNLMQLQENVMASYNEGAPIVQQEQHIQGVAPILVQQQSGAQQLGYFEQQGHQAVAAQHQQQQLVLANHASAPPNIHFLEQYRTKQTPPVGTIPVMATVKLDVGPSLIREVDKALPQSGETTGEGYDLLVKLMQANMLRSGLTRISLVKKPASKPSARKATPMYMIPAYSPYGATYPMAAQQDPYSNMYYKSGAVPGYMPGMGSPPVVVMPPGPSSAYQQDPSAFPPWAYKIISEVASLKAKAAKNRNSTRAAKQNALWKALSDKVEQLKQKLAAKRNRTNSTGPPVSGNLASNAANRMALRRLQTGQQQLFKMVSDSKDQILQNLTASVPQMVETSILENVPKQVEEVVEEVTTKPANLARIGATVGKTLRAHEYMFQDRIDPHERAQIDATHSLVKAVAALLRNQRQQNLFARMNLANSQKAAAMSMKAAVASSSAATQAKTAASSAGAARQLSARMDPSKIGTLDLATQARLEGALQRAVQRALVAGNVNQTQRLGAFFNYQTGALAKVLQAQMKAAEASGASWRSGVSEKIADAVTNATSALPALSASYFRRAASQLATTNSALSTVVQKLQNDAQTNALANAVLQVVSNGNNPANVDMGNQQALQDLVEAFVAHVVTKINSMPSSATPAAGVPDAAKTTATAATTTAGGGGGTTFLAEGNLDGQQVDTASDSETVETYRDLADAKNDPSSRSSSSKKIMNYNNNNHNSPVAAQPRERQQNAKSTSSMSTPDSEDQEVPIVHKDRGSPEAASTSRRKSSSQDEEEKTSKNNFLSDSGDGHQAQSDGQQQENQDVKDQLKVPSQAELQKLLSSSSSTTSRKEVELVDEVSSNSVGSNRRDEKGAKDDVRTLRLLKQYADTAKLDDNIDVNLAERGRADQDSSSSSTSAIDSLADLRAVVSETYEDDSAIRRAQRKAANVAAANKASILPSKKAQAAKTTTGDTGGTPILDETISTFQELADFASDETGAASVEERQALGQNPVKKATAVRLPPQEEEEIDEIDTDTTEKSSTSNLSQGIADLPPGTENVRPSPSNAGSTNMLVKQARTVETLQRQNDILATMASNLRRQLVRKYSKTHCRGGNSLQGRKYSEA